MTKIVDHNLMRAPMNLVSLSPDDLELAWQRTVEPETLLVADLTGGMLFAT